MPKQKKVPASARRVVGRNGAQGYDPGSTSPPAGWAVELTLRAAPALAV